MSDEDTVRKFASCLDGKVYGPYENTNGVKLSWKAHIEGQDNVQRIYQLFKRFISDRRCEQFERVLADV